MAVGKTNVQTKINSIYSILTPSKWETASDYMPTITTEYEVGNTNVSVQNPSISSSLTYSFSVSGTGSTKLKYTFPKKIKKLGISYRANSTDTLSSVTFQALKNNTWTEIELFVGRTILSNADTFIYDVDDDVEAVCLRFGSNQNKSVSCTVYSMWVVA